MRRFSGCWKRCHGTFSVTQALRRRGLWPRQLPSRKSPNQPLVRIQPMSTARMLLIMLREDTGDRAT